MRKGKRKRTQSERRLAAILAADIAGYSALMGADEERTVRDLKGHQAVVLPMIANAGGRVIDTAGDGILAEFASVLSAVRCAIAIQRTMAERNARVEATRRMQFRIGINQGDVVFDGSRIYGDGVNIAARLEGLTEPGGICISAKVHDEIRGRVSLRYHDMGLQQLKNIVDPVRVYRVELSPDAGLGAPALPRLESPAPPLPDRPSIAVLPFANLSGDPEQEYFVDGVVEDVLTALSRVRWLFVIARQSSFSYRGRALDVKSIGRELGVRYVVEGSIRKVGNRVRITAQLIDAQTDAHIWADRYERDLSDIFALQDEITERIVAAIEPSVRSVEVKRAIAKRTENLTAYDLYLRALPRFHAQTEEGVRLAEALLRQAIELDPEYPEALGSLTDCITMRTLNGWSESVPQGRAEASEFARRALAVGPENSTCLAGAAFTYACLGRRYEEALELAERAIQLHPNSEFVRNRVGIVYNSCGEGDKAIAQYEAAERVNPRSQRSSTMTFTGISAAHFYARRFEECVYWGKRALAIAPEGNVARRHVAAALAHLGRIDEARAEIAEVVAHQPNASLSRSRHSSFRYEWMYELYLDGLRKAGLPEN